jgi:protein associated with RNAse G/E
VTGQNVRVCSTKYDGSPHWEFDAFLAHEDARLFVVQGFAGLVCRTWKGPWTDPFDSRGHYWTDRWYNVIRCERPQGGGLEYWYCNIGTPAEFDGETLRYVDLDLDVIVSPSGECRVVDEDEFLEHSGRMGYPPDVIEHSRRAVDEILELVRRGDFPFGPAR